MRLEWRADIRRQRDVVAHIGGEPSGAIGTQRIGGGRRRVFGGHAAKKPIARSQFDDCRRRRSQQRRRLVVAAEANLRVRVDGGVELVCRLDGAMFLEEAFIRQCNVLDHPAIGDEPRASRNARSGRSAYLATNSGENVSRWRSWRKLESAMPCIEWCVTASEQPANAAISKPENRSVCGVDARERKSALLTFFVGRQVEGSSRLEMQILRGRRRRAILVVTIAAKKCERDLLERSRSPRPPTCS